MQLTLIRHLPTDWNKKTWLQGKKDIGISSPSEALQHEIQRNVHLLKNKTPFDLILASTLKRTQQTAAVYGFQAKTEALLDELDFGPFEGQPKENLLNKYGHQWMKNPKSLILGENVTNLEIRIVEFLAKYQQHSNILIFGHGSWIRALKSYWKYGEINQMNTFTIDNNECITLEFIKVV
ncbi:phosphoglycerate mutase family protein [Bacillus sp. B15-48]|uniref:histidine phosphatase family protein n=1 Tax=Bacillus sp. B15-48 TaxID=1548601 RepID=UPI00193ED326|nr:phosphoglycerate mutase family protein [Bacillus sp. B15-48]MBM4762812.1 histidine phosphatase family protein [Bacillus sp. B15-48]